MDVPFRPPVVPLLIFTDLDGTLLDHDTYAFAPAKPALTRLRALRIPLIATTSKTLAEMESLAARLASPHPWILENGCSIAIRSGYFPELQSTEGVGEYCVLRCSPGYQTLRTLLVDLREQLGFRFRGFGDMSDVEVAADTGLGLAEARLARQRLCSEPVVWQDTDAALKRFRAELGRRDLNLTRGGRYWHVMGRRDKAAAMTQLQALYRKAGFDGFTTIALGDSVNDQTMLEAADIPLVIRRKDGTALALNEGRARRVSDAAGPAGWNQVMQQVLDEFAPRRGHASLASPMG
jgi:mannosyl-3-phosphoglycerate phosphatase